MFLHKFITCSEAYGHDLHAYTHDIYIYIYPRARWQSGLFRMEHGKDEIVFISKKENNVEKKHLGERVNIH